MMGMINPLAHAQVSLLDAVRSAAKNSPDFMAEMASVRAKSYSVDERQAALGPRISLMAINEWDKRRLLESNIEQGSTNGWGRDNSASISVDQVLWNPVFSALVDEAKREVQIANVELEASRLDLIENTAINYMDVLKLAETVNLFQLEIEAAAKALELAWTRYLEGTAREVDALQAEARILDMQTRLAGVQLDLQEALARLKSQTRMDIRVLTRVDDDFNPQSILPINDVQWTDLAEQTSPELILANSQKALASDKLRTAQKAFYPTLSFNVNHVFSDADRAFDTRPEYDRRAETSAGITLSWDLYQGGGRSAAVSRAKNELVASDFALSAQQSFVKDQVAVSARRVTLERKRLKSLQATKKTLARVLAERRASFDAGLIDLPTLLDAERDWVKVVAEVKFVQYDVMLAVIRLNRFAGTLDDNLMVRVQMALKDAVSITKS